MKVFIVLLVASVAFSSQVPEIHAVLRNKRHVVYLVPSPAVVPVIQPLSVVRPIVAARANCGVPSVRCEGTGCDAKAIGGVPSVRNEYPWVVQIMSNGQQLCGGSLIDNQYVLTAASCLEPSRNSRVNPQSVAALRVIFGEYRRGAADSGYPIERNVSVAYLHADYKPPSQTESPVYDIAVLKLGSPVVFSNRVQPICLDDGTYRLDTGMFDGIVAGWGKTSYNTLGYPSEQHKSKVNAISQIECKNIYAGYNYPIRDEEICAGIPTRNGVSDACVSDLGGPLFYRAQGNFFIQSGVASWGLNCNGPPGVFTRVSVFKAWIDAVRARENIVRNDVATPYNYYTIPTIVYAK